MAELSAGMLLGQLLVASGAISEEDLAEALRYQPATGKPLGQLLVDMGALAPRQLERALRVQSRLRGGPPSAGGLILVVDDDPEIGALLGEILTGAGYRVGIAADAEEALAVLMAVDGDRPALIVLDMGLPRQDGLELLTTLRGSASGQRVPVIVLTGRPELQSEIEARGLWVSRVLGKPVLARRLLSEVETTLGEARPVAQAAAR